MPWEDLIIDFTLEDEHLLVVEGEGLQAARLNQLQLRMLKYNRIPNILPLKLTELNHQLKLSYTLTGYRLFSTYLREEKREPIEYLQLFIQICESLREIKDYLLDTRNVFLHPDYLFVEEHGRQPYFVYLPLTPQEKSHVVEQLQQVLFKYLSCVEDQQRTLRQDLLKLSEQPNLSLIQLQQGLERLISAYIRGQKNSGAQDLAEQEKLKEAEVEGKGDNRKGEYTAAARLLHTENQKPPKRRIQERLMTLFSGVFKSGSKNSNARPTHSQKEQHLLSNDNPLPQHVAQTRLLPLHAQTSRLTHVQYSSPTSQPFTHLEGSPGGGLHLYLVHRNERIKLNRYPFVIGRNESGVQYRLEDTSISRLHVEIIQNEQQGLLIRDLGSRNDTYVNQCKLIPYKYYPLRVADQINLASEVMYLESIKH